jgi:hypothetical protein
MMKNKMTKILGLGIILAAFSTGVNAQTGDTKSATATATIIAGIELTKNVDLNFGNVAVNALAGGTVVLPATAAATRTATGGVTLPATAGTVTAAQYDVDGEDGVTYLITFPSSSITITEPISTATMTVDNFVTNQSHSSVTNQGILTGGTSSFYVGATLNVNNAQNAGVYVGTYDVKVDYN